MSKETEPECRVQVSSSESERIGLYDIDRFKFRPKRRDRSAGCKSPPRRASKWACAILIALSSIRKDLIEIQGASSLAGEQVSDLVRY